MITTALNYGSKNKSIRRKHTLLSFLHELNVTVRFVLILIRSTAGLHMARLLGRTGVPAFSKPVSYDKKKFTPRGRYKFLEACKYENAIADKTVLGLVLPIQRKVFRYLFFRRATLDELYYEFAGMTKVDSFYTDDVVADLLFNGIWPVPLRQDPLEDTRFYWEQRFDGYETQIVGKLPGFKLEVEMHDNKPRLTSITFYPQGEACPIVRTPDCGESWLTAKMAAFGIWHYLATIDFHAAGCHLNIEQYYIALCRNIHPDNPLYELLYPHLKGCTAVNHLADLMILAPGGALRIAGPLTNASFDVFLRNSVAQYDWKHWRPPGSLGHFHSNARAANVYWSLLAEYVNRYFALHESDIKSHWYEISAFSQDLTEHSVRKSDGSPSISPITGASPEEEIQNLKEVCRYLIHWITFEHARTYQALPYPFCQTIQNTIKAYQHETDSDDWYEAYVKMGVALALVRGVNDLAKGQKARTLLQNYDGDVPELFLRLLVARKPEFDAVNYDINLLRQVID